VKVTDTFIKDLKILEPKVFTDERGYFFEPFNKYNFQKHFGEINFIQDNESKSTRGVLRGFHFQKPPYEQSKLVRCVKGKVLDIALDLRKESKTFGKYESVVLSETNKKQFFIPKGFAHAFLVLSNEAIFSYKVDNVYAPKFDSGVFWDDPELNINWGINKSEIIISEKDLNLKLLKNLESPF